MRMTLEGCRFGRSPRAGSSTLARAAQLSPAVHSRNRASSPRWSRPGERSENKLTKAAPAPNDTDLTHEHRGKTAREAYGGPRYRQAT